METKNIGNKIYSTRKEQGITLDDIALKVGVAKSTIQRYETGKIINPKLPVIESIANALNVNPAWLIGKSDIKTVPVPAQSLPQIVEYYEHLNDLGKHEAIKRVKELTYIPKYTQKMDLIAAHNDHITDTDELEKTQADIANLKRPN